MRRINYEERMKTIIAYCNNKNGKIERRISKEINGRDSAYSNYKRVKNIINDEKFRIMFMYLTDTKQIKEEEEEKFKMYKAMAEEDLKNLHSIAHGKFTIKFKEFCKDCGIDTEYRTVRIPGPAKNFEEYFIFGKNYQGKEIKIYWNEINPILAL